MRRGLSLLFASLCLLMLALGASPALAADSGQCAPANRSFTVSPGGTYTIDLSQCSTWGLDGSSQAPQHGILQNSDGNNFSLSVGNPEGIVIYKNNNDGATSDSFTLLDDSNGEIHFTVTIPGTPSAPTIGAVTAGNAQASVSFTPPTNNGGSPITSYTVTSTPGNFTGYGPSSPITVNGLANNTPYTFTVTATNADGTGAPSTASSPATPKALAVITGVSPNSGPVGGGTNVTVIGSGFTGATGVRFGASSGTGITVVSDTQITATAPAGAGVGTVDITVTTPAGTSITSAADQFSYVAAPVVSSISPTTGLSSGGSSVIITGSGFTGATAVTFGPTSATAFTVNSATQITATSPAGTGTVDVRVTTAGGTSATSGADQFTYNPGPVVTGISPNSGPTSGGTSVTVTGTGFTGVTAITFGGVSGTNATVVNSTQITVTSPAGTGTVDVQVTTGVGTSPANAADKFTYLPPPAVTSISPAGGPTGGGTSVVINGSGFTGATAVTFGAAPASSFTVNSATQITATAPAGTGTVDVRVTTAGGTSATSAADQFTYIAAPAVSSLSPTAGPSSGGTSVVINGSGFTGATAVTFGAAPASSFTVNSATQITATAPAGTGTVDVRVTTAGGTSATSAADQFTYVGAPVVNGLSSAAGPSSGGTSVVINGSGFTGATAVTFGAAPASSFTVNSATQITATAPAGTGTVDVRVTTAGGTSATSAADQFTYVGAPVVNGLSSAAGPSSGGTSVVITGTGFSGAMAVTFGATAASSFTVNSATQITATAPAGAGTVDVRVTTAGGTSATSGADQFTYIGTPVVSSISPTSGPSTGGTNVVINGSGFSGATAVTFGATAATGFTVNSATQITASAPAGTGTVDIRVTTAGGTSATSAADQFTYIGAPIVSSLSPTAGPSTGGTSVVINGSGFSGATAVTFGATAATGVTVNSNTQITATAPAGAGTVDVRVTTVGGTSATSAADQFTYIGAPTVSSLSPAAGPTSGGTSVVITGSGFSTTTAVTFGGTAASGYTVNSNTQITATAPAGTGTVDVRVTTLGGTSTTSAADQFTYIGAPTVGSLSPASGPTSGGNSVTINGTGLSGATAVTFGATPATGFTINSATQITATAPAGTGTVDIRVTTAGGTSTTSAADQYTYADVVVGAVAATVAYNSPATSLTLDFKGGSPTSVAVASNPAHGTAIASGTDITYMPTASFVGADSFTYTATKGGITSAPATVSITVSPPTTNVTAAGSWTATRGVLYTQTLTWSGGTAPYSNYTALGLPSGLSVTNPTATSAVISGIPTQAGSFSVTASAKDSSTGSGPFTHAATFALTVNAASALTLTPGTTTFNATSGTAFSQAFTASGGLAPYTLIQSGALPAGVTWNAATATLAGEPTESGDFAFTITASDSSTGAAETFVQSYTLKVANEIPVAPAQSINSAGPGQPVVVNLTSNATGGPFTGANLISIVPANAGTATISAVGAGAAGMRMLAAAGNNYSLRFVPNPDVGGQVALTYTLSNATSTSRPGVITISLSSRSDPSKDAEVQGLINAQANSSRRFASGQISNFQQRLEALHAGNVSSFSNGFTLTSASLQRQHQRQSLNDDPTGIEQWMQIQSAKLQSEQSLRLNPTNTLTSKTTQALKTNSVGELSPELGSQSADAPTSPLAFWTSGTISIGDDASGKSKQSQDFVTSGLSVGADYRLAPNLTVGLGFGYGHDKTDIGDNGSRSQADSYSLALYGSYRPFENIYLDGVLGYQRLTFDNRRYVTDNAGMVNGNRDGSQIFLSLAAGYEYRQKDWMLSPYARLDLANATLDKYRERGDDMFALSYDEQKVKTTSTSLGLRSEYARSTGIGILTPSLRVEYQHDFQGAGDAAMRYADVIGDGALYHVKVDALGQDRGVFGLGLGLLTESDLSLNMEYQYTLSSGAQKAQSVLFNLRKPF